MKKVSCIIACLFLFLGSLLPVSAMESFDIVSAYAILINLDDGEVLYEKNSEERMYPASMTKVMTVFTALEYLPDLQTKMTITNEMLEYLAEEGASVAGFSAGEQVTLQDLIYGALLPSGADACRALATFVAGSESEFVELMNQKATTMGLTNTHFVNTTGLHEEEHYTTVKEMAQIVEVAIQNEIFYKVFTTASYTTTPTAQHPEGLALQSTLRKQEKNNGFSNDVITGAKTGFTLEGGLCLASIGYRDHAHYLLVTGNAGEDDSYPQHIADAHAIYDYLYATYDYQQILPKDQEIDEITVKYNLFDRHLSVFLTQALSVLVNREYDVNQIDVNFDGAKEIEAPIIKDQVLGNIVVSYEGETIKQIPFKASKDIDRNGLLYGMAMIINFIVSIRYLLLAILIVFIAWIGYRRYKVIQRRKRRQQRRRKK